jgi:hypothetical protein
VHNNQPIFLIALHGCPVECGNETQIFLRGLMAFLQGWPPLIGLFYLNLC